MVGFCLGEKAPNFYTQKEDPGISHQMLVYMPYMDSYGTRTFFFRNFPDFVEETGGVARQRHQNEKGKAPWLKFVS